MRAVVFLWVLLTLATKTGHPRHTHEKAPVPVAFSVGGLTFLIPPDWEAEPIESRARAAQWQIAPPAGVVSEKLEVVVFFFGQGIGGTAQENIKAWAGTITTPDGHAASPTSQTRDVLGHRITEALFSGTYAQVSEEPGLPAAQKPNYSLLGEVIENSAGSLYWRVTGPTAQVTAFVPVLDRIVDGLQPQPAL